MSHEVALVRAFIRPEKRERVENLLASEKGRHKLRKQLSHFSSYLMPERCVDVQQLSDAALIARLQQLGAGSTAYFICEKEEFDKQQLPLAKILDLKFWSDIGFFASCVPGKLVFYQGERGEGPFILVA